MAGTDYAKKTVAELQEILKSRSLPSSGKKAELVARLNEADKEAETNAEEKVQPAEATTAPPEQTTTESGAVPNSAEINLAPATAASEPNPLSATTEPPSVDSAEATSPDTTLATQTYALNLPTSAVDAEMAKRAARAARFGTATSNTTTNNTNGETGAAGTESKDDEAKRALERAKRFGTGQTAMGKLDEALPVEGERGSRKRGRGTEETSAMDDPGLIKRGGGGFRGRGRGRDGPRGGARRNHSRPAGAKPIGVQKSSVFSNEQDRAAAEARKKKFGVTA